MPCFVAIVCSLRAEDKKPPENEPKILYSVPLGVTGGVSKVKLRGLNFDEASEVRAEGAAVKIQNKDKPAIPNGQDAKKLGGSQVEIEVTLPADAPQGKLSLVVVTSVGPSQSYEIPVDVAAQVVNEKEPNNGFTEAQPVATGQIVVGAIDPAQNVDVFSYEGQAGEKVIFEVEAGRRGSPLDSGLKLYDSRGVIVAASDDPDGSPDARIELALPAAGKYYLSLFDANDQGSPSHVYRLLVKRGE